MCKLPKPPASRALCPRMGSGSSAFSLTDSSLTWERTTAGCPHSSQALRCRLHCRPLYPVSTPPCDPGCSSRAFLSRVVSLLLTRRENGFSAQESGNHGDGIAEAQEKREAGVLLEARIKFLPGECLEIVKTIRYSLP